MVENSENTPDIPDVEPLETAEIVTFEGVGEITIGVGSNWNIIATALCLQDDPQVNKYLLAQRLQLVDRITKTRIFPRVGMALPDGEIYVIPGSPDMEEKKEG